MQVFLLNSSNVYLMNRLFREVGSLDGRSSYLQTLQKLHLPSTELCTSSTLDSRSRRCTIHESESNLSLCLQSVALLRISGQVVRAERGLGNVSVCTQKVLSRRICRSRLTPKFFVQTWDLWFFSSRSLGSTILCILISWYAIIWPSSPKFSCGDQFRTHFTRTISFHLLLN